MFLTVTLKLQKAYQITHRTTHPFNLDAFVKAKFRNGFVKKLHIRGAEMSYHFGVLRYVEMI